MMHHLYRRQGVLYDGWSTHSEGASSSVPVELVEMTLPVAGCLKVPCKKESGCGRTGTLFLDCADPAIRALVKTTNQAVN